MDLDLPDFSGNSKLFMDKLKLSALALDKEIKMIQAYTILIEKMRRNYVKKEKLNKYDSFIGTGSCMFELWSFLEENKFKKHENKLNGKGDVIKAVMGKWENNEELTFEELQSCFKGLKEVMSLSGYHDDSINTLWSGNLEDEGS